MSRGLCLPALLLCLTASPLPGGDPPARPGPTGKGFLLPNGWTITPAGKHVTLTDLPLNIIPLTDGKRALVATSGFNKHELSLVDLAEPKVIASELVRQSWFGLAMTPGENHIWWSGGGINMLHTFDLKGDRLIRTSPPDPDPAKLPKEELDKLKKQGTFKSGLAFDARKQILYSLDINAGRIAAISRD